MDITIVYYNDNKNKTLQTASGQQGRKGNKMMYSELIREATNEEMEIFNRVEAVTKEMDDDEYERFYETIGDRVFDWKREKAIYQRVYRLGKKYGFTVDELETWYCMD